jgi:hypothetical protein
MKRSEAGKRSESVDILQRAVSVARKHGLGAVTLPPDVVEALQRNGWLNDGGMFRGVQVKAGGPKRWKDQESKQ